MNYGCTHLHGILPLDKQLGLTSAQAVERVRRILGRPKIGHAGSLDPLATGVLVVCVGRGTKLVERLMDQPKIYRASARLDITTPSFDLETEAQPVEGIAPVTESQVRATLRALEGAIMQAPPLTSAVKIAGRAAYKLARRGELTELPPRRVQVYWIALRRFDWPALDFDVACGRGTYIRALIRDIGAQLGVGGCLTALERRASGPLCVADAWTLPQLGVAPDPTAAIISMDRAAALLATPTEPPVRPGPE